MVDCGVYVDGQRLPGKQSPRSAMEKVRELGSGFVWIGLHEPDEHQMQVVADVFGLHPLAVEDAVHAHQRPKLERYDDTLFLVLKTVNYVPHESISLTREIVETGEIMVFVGPEFVVTVRHGNFGGLVGLRKEMEANPGAPWTGSLRRHARRRPARRRQLSRYHDADRSRHRHRSRETFAAGRKTDIEQIYLLKREIVELRRAIRPLSAALERITTDHQDLVPAELMGYMRDVLDHQRDAADRIINYDDMLSSLVQAAVGKVGVQQNIDMRKISAWVAIAAVVRLRSPASTG